MAADIFIFNPKAFIDSQYDLARLGDIRDISVQQAQDRLRTLQMCELVHAVGTVGVAIASGDSEAIAADTTSGYDLLRSISIANIRETEWRAVAQRFRSAKLPGILYVYDRDVISIQGAKIADILVDDSPGRYCER